MDVYRLGNLDIRLFLASDEFSQAKKFALENIDSDRVVATGKIKSTEDDPLYGTEVNLIYNPKRDRDCGVDCSEMIRHFEDPPIPVYISGRAVRNLSNGELCGSAFLQYKLEIKVRR